LAKIFGGKWRHVRDLPGGGQAHTYEVRNDQDQTDANRYALKSLKNLKRLERFRREVAVVRSLDHPNIIRIVDAELDSARPFLVSELCAGGSLADTSLTRFSVHERLLLFRDVCVAACVAHQQGITHRDIKPGNVLLRTESGPAVLADFGLSFVEDGLRETLVDEAIGPRLYMAPELEDGRAEEISPASDVYSLGKLLYYLVSGGMMFAREKHREAKYNLVKLLGDEKFEHINRILDRTVVYEGADRFINACELIPEVERVDRLLSGGYRALSHPPQKCAYCGEGNYERVATESQYDQMQQLGFSTPGTVMWRVFICNHCGHVLWFRPDHAKDTGWLDRT
jgi:serine/threonine protein kinase